MRTIQLSQNTKASFLADYIVEIESDDGKTIWLTHEDVYRIVFNLTRKQDVPIPPLQLDTHPANESRA